MMVLALPGRHAGSVVSDHQVVTRLGKVKGERRYSNVGGTCS